MCDCLIAAPVLLGQLQVYKVIVDNERSFTEDFQRKQLAIEIFRLSGIFIGKLLIIGNIQKKKLLNYENL